MIPDSPSSTSSTHLSEAERLRRPVRPQKTDRPENDAPPSPGALRLLVVEDNADAAETLRDLLLLFGHEVELARTGAEGIEMAHRLRPQVVLCDIGLPGLDGYGVARALREDPDTAAIRLIALTGYGRESDRQRSEEAGFEVHLVKPVDPAELKSLLARWAAERP
jgi:two-component system CheB/CheR fusion protein